jgi:hypothetical protein
MPDLPIAPDESSGEPRCQPECPSAHWSAHGVFCRSDHDRYYPPSSLCLPRIRELLAISRRRCDGCQNDTEGHGVCPDINGALAPDGSCSRWEAKP